MSDSLPPHGLYSPWNSPGWNTGVGSLSHSRGSSQPRAQTQVSRIAGGFFTSWATREAHYTTMKWSEVKLLSCVRLFETPWTVAHQAPPSMGFSRQEYWSGLPFPSPRDLPNPGIKPTSPALQADALTSEPPGKLGRAINIKSEKVNLSGISKKCLK